MKGLFDSLLFCMLIFMSIKWYSTMQELQYANGAYLALERKAEKACFLLSFSHNAFVRIITKNSSLEEEKEIRKWNFRQNPNDDIKPDQEINVYGVPLLKSASHKRCSRLPPLGEVGESNKTVVSYHCW